MKLLVFNAGSSSLKYRLFELADGVGPVGTHRGATTARLTGEELAALSGELSPFPALG